MTDPRGVVFDLGYRPHEGPRLGRSGAVRALYRDGLRKVLGLRRRARQKVFPWLLMAIAVLPALFFIAFGVIAGELGEAEFFDHALYFELTGAITLVFVALASSELLVPDRVNGVMAVYASRPLTTTDYLVGRAASLGTVVVGFLYLPHLVLVVGRAWVNDAGFADYLVEHLDVLWQTALASAVYVVAFGSIALVVAAFAGRTAAAVFAVVLIVPVSGPASAVLVDSGAFAGAGLLALQHHPGYVKDWILSDNAHAWIPERAGFEPVVSLAVIAAIAAAAAVVVYQRYARLR
jgi:ABC-2 type transport system permease protein